MRYRMVIVAINADIQETQYVAEKHRQKLLQMSQSAAMRYLISSSIMMIMMIAITPSLNGHDENG